MSPSRSALITGAHPIAYGTEHDEVGRATSCGLRTSRLMVKVLCEEAMRLDIPFITRTTGVRILQQGGRVNGLIAISRERSTNPYVLAVILCERLVLATGGPGELNRDSMYPKNCFGSLGMAIHIESRKGHRILMDFNRNPQPVPGDKAISLEDLDDDVHAYLANTVAAAAERGLCVPHWARAFP